MFRGLMFDYEKFSKFIFSKQTQMSIVETCKKTLIPF